MLGRQGAHAVPGEHVRLGQPLGRGERGRPVQRVGPEQPAQLASRRRGPAGPRRPGPSPRARRRRSAGPATAARSVDQCARRAGSSSARARSAATATACESASASGAGGTLPSAPTIPPPCPSRLGSRPSRQPCWASPPGYRRGPQRTSPPPSSRARSSQPPAAVDRRGQLGLQRGVPGRGEQGQEPGGGVRGAVVAQRAVAHRPARLDQPARRDRAPLVQDPPRLLVDLRVVGSALPGGQRPQRRRRDVRAARQQLQREDQRVAAEQGVEAARVAGLDRQRRRVGPALGGEQAGHRGVERCGLPSSMPGILRPDPRVHPLDGNSCPAGAVGRPGATRWAEANRRSTMSVSAAAAAPAAAGPARTALATVCISGTLEDKLAAAAAAGFDGVEIFEPDLVASPLSPAAAARAGAPSWACRSTSTSRSATSTRPTPTCWRRTCAGRSASSTSWPSWAPT